MNVVDLLITIVVVTILVTIVLAVITYVAYKLRLAREPGGDATGSDTPRYFVPYPPPEDASQLHRTGAGPGNRMGAGTQPDASAGDAARANGTDPAEVPEGTGTPGGERERHDTQA